MRARPSHRALALRLLGQALLRVPIEILRVLAHVHLWRGDLLDNALGERVLACRLASAVQLLVIEEHGLGVLVLLTRSNARLRLAQARAAQCVEFVYLHLL